MCLVKTLLDKIVKTRLDKTRWKKNLVKEKKYTYLIIHIMDASLKTLQGKSIGTNLVRKKKVHRVLTPPNDNINSETRIFVFKLIHHLLESCSW